MQSERDCTANCSLIGLCLNKDRGRGGGGGGGGGMKGENEGEKQSG